MNTKKIALYTRVSTGYQIDKDSLPFQKQELKSYCKYVLHADMSLIEVYEDAGRSGKNTKRPGFERMMEEVKNDKISHVIVYKIDRISRNLVDFSLMYDEFKFHRVTFISLNEQFDTSSAIGEAILKIILVFAELERKLTSERVKDIMINRAQAGQWNGARVPFGWDWDEKNACPIHSKTEGPLVVDMYNMYLEVKSTLKIRDYNNTHNIRTKRGGEWTSKTVGDLLRNPMNRGDYRYNYRESARGRKKPDEEVIYLENVFPPLVDAEIWDKVNRIMDYNRDVRNTSGMHTNRKLCNVFAGLIVCGKCGANYQVDRKDYQRKNGFRPSLYHCTAKNKKIACSALNVSEVQIGPFVINYISGMVRLVEMRKKITNINDIETILLSNSVFADIAGIDTDGLNNTFMLLKGKNSRNSTLWDIDTAKQDMNTSGEVNELRKKIEKFKRAQERLEDAYFFDDTAMDEKEYLEKKVKFESRRIAAENELKSLTSQNTEQHYNNPAFLKTAAAFLLAHKIRSGEHIVYSELAPAVGDETLKKFFNSVLDHIVVKDKKIVEIVFANGLSHKILYRD